tara:strand:+ start:65 stop:220 length:156 start_codon:yes stop_codon:yes gene_type:complete
MEKKYIDAFIVGFMFAVIFWAIAKDNLTLAGLIPSLYIIYIVVKKSKNKKK